jgi:hypothetical protein
MKLRILFLITIAAAFFSGCSRLIDNPFQGKAVIDWVDFVKLNGYTYTGLYNRTLQDPGLVTDRAAGEVKFKVADVVTNPNYRTKDGDAAFLEMGTKLYEVEGFAVHELIAVHDEHRTGGYRLYAEEGFAETIDHHYRDMPKDKIERVELFRSNETKPFRALTGDEKARFVELLETGTDKSNFQPDPSGGDPVHYKMMFYTDEPLAYVYDLFDDGRQVFFHPWDTRVVDAEIRPFIQPQVEFVGTIIETEEQRLLVAEAENETNLIWFSAETLPEEAQPGVLVRIRYNGNVDTSYPGQAFADSVTIEEN